MATRYDVAGRLAQGVAAVDDMQTYVAASQVRGYVNADLTLHAGQVKDWYGTEDGLDLQQLDSDCAQLHTAAQAADDALRRTHAQAAALEGAWAGGGGAAAVEFIRRHSAAGAEAADAVRRAAQACATLRDQLWSVVDHKVGVTVSIDDRTVAERPGWLAAARAVIAGDQDESSVATVDTAVKPFVDNGIRGEWVPAMRVSEDEATAAYRSAVATIGIGSPLRFEVPGDLGPRYIPPAGMSVAPAPVAARPAAVVPPVDEWPANLSDPIVPIPDSPAPPVAPAAPPMPATVPPSPSLPAAPPEMPMPTAGLGSMPGTGGGGLGQLSNPIGDLLGSLFGSSGNALPDAQELPEAGLDDPAPDLPVEDSEDTDTEEDDPEDAADADDPTEAGDEAEAHPEAVAGEPEPPPANPPPPPPSAPPAQPLAAVPEAGASEAGTSEIKTPCEIAADELPQAGQ